MCENSGFEAQRVEVGGPKGLVRGPNVESRGRVLREGTASPPPHQLGNLGQCCNVPQ